jgi:ribonucleotide monophosphatase NagD (HAD superfamily)
MRPTLTVDFDNCLAFESVQNTGWIVLGTGVLKPIKAVHDLVRGKHREGFDIHCVTFREDKDIDEVKAFVKEHNLPITEIHNTSSKSKTPVLKRLKSVLHVDDSLSVCMGAASAGIKCIFVDCGQHLDESQRDLASIFEIIRVELD